jgi:hypothetical protein
MGDGGKIAAIPGGNRLGILAWGILDWGILDRGILDWLDALTPGHE